MATAVAHFSFWPRVTRTLTATYSGDANDQSSVSTPVAQTVMNQTKTKITKHSPDPAKVGRAVTVEFSVEAKDGTKQTNPTGTVTVNASSWRKLQRNGRRRRERQMPDHVCFHRSKNAGRDLPRRC